METFLLGRGGGDGGTKETLSMLEDVCVVDQTKEEHCTNQGAQLVYDSAHCESQVLLAVAVQLDGHPNLDVRDHGANGNVCENLKAQDNTLIAHSPLTIGRRHKDTMACSTRWCMPEVR